MRLTKPGRWSPEEDELPSRSFKNTMNHLNYFLCYGGKLLFNWQNAGLCPLADIYSETLGMNQTNGAESTARGRWRGWRASLTMWGPEAALRPPVRSKGKLREVLAYLQIVSIKLKHLTASEGHWIGTKQIAEIIILPVSYVSGVERQGSLKEAPGQSRKPWGIQRTVNIESKV